MRLTEAGKWTWGLNCLTAVSINHATLGIVRIPVVEFKIKVSPLSSSLIGRGKNVGGEREGAGDGGRNDPNNVCTCE
jgi:hypothetical protein